jgi:hypothetical protein
VKRYSHELLRDNNETILRGGEFSVPAFPIANAANFRAFSSGSEAAAIMRGRIGREEEEEEAMERRNVSLCLKC